MKAVIGSSSLLLLVLLISGVVSVEWKHSAVLDNNFLVLWTPGERDVTFEIQVKTLGYVGLGFTKAAESGRAGADMVIGWVDNNGQVHLQDRHVKDTSKDPQMDSSQDYRLLLGYENKTHTVLRFSRRYDTCDPRDLKITNDTMQVVWQYHVEEPVSAAGILPDHGAVRGTRPLYLVQRDAQPRRNSRNPETEKPLKIWDILNKQVRLPMGQDTLLWCRVLKMPSIDRKHHVVKYEPVIQPGSHQYLHHMTLYECRGNQTQLEAAAQTNGDVCNAPDKPAFQCNTIAATWSLGSEGFNYPPEAGYPLNPSNGPHYYMLETHYTNPQLDAFISDSSGLRLLYTEQVRVHDAGILSVGIDPNWRHIIPPGQHEVVSEGHCISDCTEQTIPNTGINMFAVIMHTHQLGRKVRLRQIRAGEELPPIAADVNYNPNYQEYRRLQRPIKVYPGDHLVAECTYSSETRGAITLGGLGTREETCLVSALYYPRIELSLCYSLPSLPTVLHSLGIQKLKQGSSPVMIEEPKQLAGLTLEERLLGYDWVTNFQSFQEVTRSGTFKPLCGSGKGALPGTDNLEVHYPRILRPYEEASAPCAKKPLRNKLSMLLSEDDDIGAPVDPDSDESNAVERGQLVRSKVSRSSDAGPTAGSSSGRTVSAAMILAVATVAVGAAFR
ncbi:MOXD1 homolog 2 isoform X2 [Odontomachus brunneus]|uniref:MOXD1 homolog 2 isoform X2 n=1 Tax=Odontomachus brunneus TaxID=486640 RepID=UPI0013F18D2B|nr:MOXD1 homolog 2 isoform X2 [Odontomachus brunneus]